MDRANYFSAQAGRHIDAARLAGQVCHWRCGSPPQFDFRGVVFDIDPVFANSEEWYESIPKDLRPNRDQPYTTSSPRMRKAPISPMSASRTWSKTAKRARWTIPVEQIFQDFDGIRYPLLRGFSH
jgi:heat shock protein HspQ